MKKGYVVLGVTMILLGLVVLYSAVANIEIAPIIKIIIGVVEILLGIFMFMSKKK